MRTQRFEDACRDCGFEPDIEWRRPRQPTMSNQPNAHRTDHDRDRHNAARRRVPLPRGPTPRGGVLLFHGNTMNFYIGAPRWLPPVLTELGFACLAFNRRGHDILSIRNSRAPEGGALQLTREGMADNDNAARWMADHGFPAPVVIAHSGGGMLGVAHAAQHPETPALVLLSAFRGGAGEQSIPAQKALAGEGYEATMAECAGASCGGARQGVHHGVELVVRHLR